MSRVRDRILEDPAATLLGLDFDGTLSPVVDDPTSAHIHPDSLAALDRLGRAIGQIAIVTGRPVREARRLGRFEEIAGLASLVICGQYGAEHWEAASGEEWSTPIPAAISELARRIPDVLDEVGMSDAHVEDKGLALAIHTRAAISSIDDAAHVLADLAAELDLAFEPGRQVVELRAKGSDKGRALRSLVTDQVRHIAYAGDDLGDLPAFRAARELRPTDSLLVCSASVEQDALVPLADIVVDGPNGIAEWLTELADDLGV